MGRSGGFAIIRSGITDHLLSSRLGFFELGIYTTIHLQADFQTGVWWGSAPRLLATAPSGTNLRQVQKALHELTAIGFLRPFHTPGARGNYPVLIDKYDIRTGALKGRRLNAAQSISWQRPCYELGAEGDAEQDTEADAEHGAEQAPYQYSGSINQEPESHHHDDDFFQALFEELKNQHWPALTWRTFLWAKDRIAQRAKTPPGSRQYWQKALTAFDFDAELSTLPRPEIQELIFESGTD